MKTPEFWISHYVTSTAPEEIRRDMGASTFLSGGETFELVEFIHASDAPNILISMGSGGHGYVFAEFAYRIHSAGFNVFIMPKHGGLTIDRLVDRHRDAVSSIAQRFTRGVGIFGEGLGGYVTFYLALAGAPVTGIVCENSPAIMSEPAFREAVLTDAGPWTRSVRRRRLIVPVLPYLARLVPWLKVPVSSYLAWEDLIDTRPGSGETERRLVVDGYLKDPDFDRWYPLSAVTSLLTTPPPAPLESLTTPTMFIVASDGPTPGYIRDLYRRLPLARKRLVEVEGSVYWMLSHPERAAGLVAEWFSALDPRQPAKGD